jgi:hypothetical protein
MTKKTKEEIMQTEHLTRPPRLDNKAKNAKLKTIKKKSFKK